MTVLRTDHDGPDGPWFPDRGLPGWAAAGIAVLLLAGALDAARALLADGRLTERGGLEVASAAGYALGLAVFAARAARPLAAWAVPVLLLAAAARELDLDKRLTDPGILQARLYTGDAPLAVKAAGLAAVLLVLAAAASLLAREGPGWMRALGAGARRAWWVAAALALALVSKSLDGIGRKLRPLGLDVPDAMNRAASFAEEALELGIPVALILAMTAGPSGAAPPREHRA